MKYLLVILFSCLLFRASGQSQLSPVHGYRHFQIAFQSSTVDILIASKKGEEDKKKPLLLFCQGSLPIPLIIKYRMNGVEQIFPVFVFNPDSLSKDFHLVIIGKPGVPLEADESSLNKDLAFRDTSGKFPSDYTSRNLLDFYVSRNIAVLKFLRSQTWVSDKRLVVAGHSEGSTIAAKIASSYSAVTDLIYSGGNPLGRILSVIERNRAAETDSNKVAEMTFDYWRTVVHDKESMDAANGDTYKATYDFSIPPLEYLEKLKIPVLVCYGTKDAASPFNDYLRVDMIRKGKINFSFNAYIGTEHNFFPVKPNGETDFETFNWDRVAGGWRVWLLSRKTLE